MPMNEKLRLSILLESAAWEALTNHPEVETEEERKKRLDEAEKLLDRSIFLNEQAQREGA